MIREIQGLLPADAFEDMATRILTITLVRIRWATLCGASPALVLGQHEFALLIYALAKRCPMVSAEMHVDDSGAIVGTVPKPADPVSYAEAAERLGVLELQGCMIMSDLFVQNNGMDYRQKPSFRAHRN
jgi:hypothetical protein